MARLLKKKLKLCVSEIVQRNQVGFVQERLLCENVLLATELVKDFNDQGPTSQNFWVLDPARRGSWIWRSICKLRQLARPMVLCEVGSGTTASFWYDNWSSVGPLIDLVGERGPQVSGLNIEAVVADALTTDGWWLDRSRSRSPLISLLKAETWRVLYPCPVEVFWHKAVWFSGRIPKHAFISWVAARDRMVTRDRLLRWGLNVPSNCVLCVGNQENRQHLFFDCAFSNQVWNYFVSRLQQPPPKVVLRWLVEVVSCSVERQQCNLDD
uniref:Reverse transcriptase zinc-binding domain-containing protein n=1 Tax=Brassica oleracea TaxID=3712 RepID=A0A3P6G4I0_BRAOL|nr:unnamed protein product [Brassica oleracea]